jgi:OmpA-OmpF porin, OOP family
MHRLLTPLLVLSGFYLSAQNLVINPGFEEHKKTGSFDLGNGFESMQVSGWYQAAGGTSDYFLTGKDRLDDEDFLKRVPGKTKANSGVCFAGFYGAGTYQEYVGGSLAVPLVKGKKYIVAIALQLGSHCRNGSTSIGVHFRADKERLEGSRQLKLHPQADFDSTGCEDVSGKWKIFRAEFVADGGEKYFIVGNFTGRAIALDGNHTNPNTYYLLDDVTVIPSDGDLGDFPVAGIPDPEPNKPVQVIIHSSSMDPKPVNDTIAAGKTLVYRNILFETDQSILLAESYPQLYYVLAEMKKQPNLKVEIRGHTDATGSAEHNLQLSEERAKAVAAFFTTNGIDPSRVSSKGFGSSQPVSSDHALNRRVEFVFTE